MWYDFTLQINSAQASSETVHDESTIRNSKDSSSMIHKQRVNDLFSCQEIFSATQCNVAKKDLLFSRDFHKFLASKW